MSVCLPACLPACLSVCLSIVFPGVSAWGLLCLSISVLSLLALGPLQIQCPQSSSENGASNSSKNCCCERGIFPKPVLWQKGLFLLLIQSVDPKTKAGERHLTHIKMTGGLIKIQE